MNSKRISVIAVFAALTIVLNMSPIKIPAPYAPFLFYQIWEIPIVTTTLLFGFGIGIVVSLVNTLILLVAFPGALPTGPIYNLIAIISTLFGLFIISKIISSRFNIQQNNIVVVISTILGIIMRVIVMTIVNWTFLPFPPPIGFSMPSEAVIAVIPIIGFFNATLALYTIPIGYILAKAVQTNVNLINDILT